MFSDRTNWNTHPNPLFERFHELNRKKEILNLAQSNPTRCDLEYSDALLQAYVNHRNFLYEPDPKGLLSAREAVSGYYRNKGAAVNPEHLFLCAGTSEAYTFLFKLLTNPGDTIMIPRPGYPLFEYLAGLENVNLIPYRLEYTHPTGWLLDTESLAKNVQTNTRAIVLIHPNNPTGSFIRPEEKKFLIEFCRKREIALIVDEVFSDYVLDAPENFVRTFAGESDALTFTLSGISKLAGLPQMKLAWIAAGGPPELLEKACSRLEIITDSFLSASTPVQNALPVGVIDRIGEGGQVPLQ